MGETQPAESKSESPACSSLTAAVERLRVVDAYGAEWGNLLREKDTDPQMAKDCVEVVRAYLREDTAKQVADLAMLVARLVKQIRQQDEKNPVAERAMDYLRRKELFPSILRGVM